MDRTGTGLAPVGKGPHQAHMVGLDGRGMTGLAQMLVERGYVVTGSTTILGPASERLHRLGVRLHAGHSSRSVPRSARLLVYGPDVAPGAPRPALGRPDRDIEQASSSRDDRPVPAPARGRDRRRRRASDRASPRRWSAGPWPMPGSTPAVLYSRTLVAATGCAAAGLGLGHHVVVEASATGRGRRRPPDGVEGRVLVLDDGRRRGRGRPRSDDGPPPRRRAAMSWAWPTRTTRRRMGRPRAWASIVEVERFSLVRRGMTWWGADVREDRGRYRFRAFHRGQFADGGPTSGSRPASRAGGPGRGGNLRPGRRGLLGRSRKPWRSSAGVSRGFESRGSYRGVTLVDDEAPGPIGRGRGVGGRPRRSSVAGRSAQPTARTPMGDDSWPTALPSSPRPTP